MLRDLLIAVSMANLWFVDVWRLFLIRHFTSYPYYHWKLNPAPLLLATMLDVLLLSAILFFAITLARRSQKQSLLAIARLSFVFLFVLLISNLLLIALWNPPIQPLLSAIKERPQSLFEWRGIATIYSWLAMLGLLIGWLGISVILHSLIFRRERLIKLSAGLALILSPFTLITFTQAAGQWFSYRSGEQFQESTSPAALQKGSSGRRLLWLVFDEFDFRLGFLERPARLNLPEFDRLRNESLFAANSYPPAGDTEIALPALINGRPISNINRTAPNEIELTFINERRNGLWSKEPNLFSRARAMNFNSGLAGWFHPYCRVIGNSLTRCSWETAGILFLGNKELADLISDAKKVSIARSMLRVAGTALIPKMVRVLITGKESSEWRSYYIAGFNGVHQQAIAMAADPNLQLILAHYPIPHPPGIYDRHTDQFSFNPSSGYLDNLALADRVMKELREVMDAAGVWETTTVLISSDHRLRADRLWRKHPIWQPAITREDPIVFNSTRDERVPFILRLAGESKSLVYEPTFNTVLSHDLILAILSGEITKGEEAVEWLDRHRSITESPYMLDKNKE